MEKYWQFKKGQNPFNKGKTYKELGIEIKPRNTLSLMTKKDKERFIKMCLKNNIKFVANEFCMRLGDACKLQRELTDGYVRSLKNPNRKLTKYQVIKILVERMRDGRKQIDLANKYNVSACNISNICAGRHWKHVFQGVREKYNPEILSVLERGQKIK
jgi:hypothetical protein